MVVHDSAETADRLAAQAQAYAVLEARRWPAGPRCPHCGAQRVYFLRAGAGAGRATRTGRVTGRRVWKCARCRRQFSALTATIWHGTRLDVATWVSIARSCATTGAVPDVASLRRDWALSPEAARHVVRLLGPALEYVGALHGPQDGAPDGKHILGGLLGLDATTAAALRAGAARRRRPPGRAGPSADYGTG